MPDMPSTDEPRDAILVDAPPAAQPVVGGWRDVVDNRWLIVAMLFFVSGALGLPLLWMSRGFSATWKIVLSIAVLAWTALVLWVFWLIMVWCYGQIAEAVGW